MAERTATNAPIQGTAADLIKLAIRYAEEDLKKEGLLEKLGLYQNIEEKREKKKQRIMNRITKKYMSHIQKDEFFSRIMDKKIINSEFYLAQQVFLKNLFKELIIFQIILL